MFGEMAVSVMFKEYTHMEYTEIISGVDTYSLKAEQNEIHSGQSTL